MLEQIFQNIDFISQNKLKVYRGNGIFEELEIQASPGISQDEIRLVEEANGIVLPAAYVEFLKQYNGIAFFHYADCQFWNLATSIECSKVREEFKDRFLIIGTFYDDYILIDCKDDQGGIFVSIEGISKPLSLDMAFPAFLEKCFLSNFYPFW